MAIVPSRGLLKYFPRAKPKDGTIAIPIKKPWYRWLVSATPIVRLLLMNGLHWLLLSN